MPAMSRSRPGHEMRWSAMFSRAMVGGVRRLYRLIFGRGPDAHKAMPRFLRRETGARAALRTAKVRNSLLGRSLLRLSRGLGRRGFRRRRHWRRLLGWRFDRLLVQRRIAGLGRDRRGGADRLRHTGGLVLHRCRRYHRLAGLRRAHRRGRSGRRHHFRRVGGRRLPGHGRGLDHIRRGGGGGFAFRRRRRRGRRRHRRGLGRRRRRSRLLSATTGWSFMYWLTP